MQKLTPTFNITLENVKKANYWELIALVVWNHYREQKQQDESSVEIFEDWYGKMEGGSSSGNSWQDPNYRDPNNLYVRTLGSIVIKFTRSDFITYIYISVESGNVNYFGIYTNKNEKTSPNYHSARAVDLMNWMLEHSFIELTSENIPS